MVTITLPDGSIKEYENEVTPGQVAADIGPGLARAAMAAEVNGQIVGLDYLIPNGNEATLKLFTKKDPEALGVMRHSAAHVMARAIMRIFPGVQLAFGPTIDGGFYYDFDLDHKLSGEDFETIEAEMKKIIKADEPFERIETGRDEALNIVNDLGQEYKVEHIRDGLTEHDQLSFYRQGEFIDLCRGPHVPSAGAIGAYKLLSVAGAYWKGSSDNQQLQRVYATAFFDKGGLEEHLTKIDEAKRRDHRTLGKQLGLFHIDDMVGQGLILWTPKGACVRQKLQEFIGAHLQRQGYDQVFTPHIGKLDLYKTSGHFPYYQESQYPALINRDYLNKVAEEGCSCSDLANSMAAGEIEGYLLKPMNCPHHIKIYDSQQRSYRDLPIRLAEFGTVYRWEQSGEIGGLTRVRGFTQDDAHLFITEDQLAEELEGCLDLVKIVFASVGMEDYSVRIGLRDKDSDKYVGDPEDWDKAEDACRHAAATLGKPFIEEEGEAAFYGPKIDFVVNDCLGRKWQLGTVQVDYNLPIRFDLSYIGADNQSHRPVMIHRAPFGSMERFIGVLIEHFAGAFPLWLAPEQARIVVVSQKFEEYGRQVEAQLREAGIRVSGDYRAEKIGAKIRDAQLELIPYMLIVGGREMENGEVSVRDRIDGDLGAMPIDTALAKFQDEIENRVVRKTFSGSAGLVSRDAQNEY
ncbi:MAG: threonine--tRNA ligase [Pirellulaceae bacterium]|jgi:threonyl-tRNA synthetase|nr:threonine--tRNA ligase [Pirellulaceae bacterium]